MNPSSSVIPRISPAYGRLFGAMLLTTYFLLGSSQPIEAQTYSLSPAWSAAVGTANITTADRNRGLAYDAVNNQVFVANRNGATSAIDVFNGTSGALLSGSGISGAVTLAIDQVGVSDDGVLYGVPLTTSLSTTTGSLKIYSWTNWAANSTGFIAYQSDVNDAAVVNIPSGTPVRRIGDTMAVTGSGTNTLILLGTGGAFCQGTNFVLLSTADGINFTSTVVYVPTGLPPTTTGGNIYGITFFTNNTFIVLPGPGAGGASMNPYLVQFPANFRGQPTVFGTVLGSVNLAAFTATRTTHISYAPGPKMLALTQATTGGAGISNTNAIYNASAYPGSLTQLAKTNFATAAANVNNTGAIALGGAGRTNFLYVLQSNNGVQAYAINFTVAIIPPSISSAPAGISGAFPPTA